MSGRSFLRSKTGNHDDLLRSGGAATGYGCGVGLVHGVEHLAHAAAVADGGEGHARQRKLRAQGVRRAVAEGEDEGVERRSSRWEP